MQYNVKTVTEYLEALEEGWRKEKLYQIRKIILDSATDISEIIEFKMLGYRGPNGTLFHLNAQKNYVSLYVGNILKIDSDRSILKGFNQGKGCVRLRKTDRVDGNIKIFIQKAVSLSKKGADLGC